MRELHWFLRESNGDLTREPGGCAWNPLYSCEEVEFIHVMNQCFPKTSRSDGWTRWGKGNRIVAIGRFTARPFVLFMCETLGEL